MAIGGSSTARMGAVLAIVLVDLLGVAGLDAQATGSITGNVMDTSGAALAGADIRVKNNATGITQSTSSDEHGRFRVPQLITGEYDVQASKAEFLTVVQRSVTVAVGSLPEVDLHLPVGQHTQAIHVSGDVSQV